MLDAGIPDIAVEKEKAVQKVLFIIFNFFKYLFKFLFNFNNKCLFNKLPKK